MASKTVTKPVWKDTILLEATVEILVMSTSLLLEIPDLLCVLAILNGADGVLVSTVGNHFLAGGNFALESFFEHGKVMLCSFLRTADPYNLI